MAIPGRMRYAKIALLIYDSVMKMNQKGTWPSLHPDIREKQLQAHDPTHDMLEEGMEYVSGNV